MPIQQVYVLKGKRTLSTRRLSRQHMQDIKPKQPHVIYARAENTTAFFGISVFFSRKKEKKRIEKHGGDVSVNILTGWIHNDIAGTARISFKGQSCNAKFSP